MEWNKLLSVETLAERNKKDKETVWNKYPVNYYEEDYEDIISSAAFRRLQDKTQVFPLDKSDFVRTRLTHSIEVSSIAKQLGIMVTKYKDEKNEIEHFKDNLTVTEAIPSVLACAGLLHDLGNPPFGHFGEVVIGDWFKEQLEKESFCFHGKAVRDVLTEQMKNDLCGFEGNAQALRILSKIISSPHSSDMNLSYSIINTLIKYPTDSNNVDKSEVSDVKKHKLGYYLSEKEVVDRICLETGTKLNDDEIVRHPLTFLLEAADDIAYATSDLEDALKKDMFTVDQFIEYFEQAIKKVKIPDPKKLEKSQELIDDLKMRIESGNRNRENDTIAFRKWINYVRDWLMYVVAFSFNKNYSEIMNGTYKYDMFKSGFHRYSIDILKGAMRTFVFNSQEILRLELSAKKIISSLLDDFVYAVINWEGKDTDVLNKADKKLINIISENYKMDYEHAKTDGDSDKDDYMNLYLRFLMVTDYISGMTDSYAKRLYQELNGIE